ncbi:hypothetical protein TI39_contig350g00006 [Zymoseptoria brevis]|uniref:tyrosinase n=1 Tax=Zymoseptoria brevis TaxID=1047168 RepID=A0A0F4GRH8_9PEZI|nr:hypothetical protein TI39_contig350g00006 [Zymoseptoria brevis]
MPKVAGPASWPPLPDTNTSPPIYTQGVLKESGGIYPRKEIDDFIKDADQLNLFLVAYHELMSQDEAAGGYKLTDMQSFFQIAGIHHIPLTVWNGGEGNALSAALKETGAQTEWNSGTDRRPGAAKDLPVVGFKSPWPFPNSGDIQYSGYCTHGTCLFPSWHRCYQVLWEQIVFKKVMEVENRFTTRSREREIAARTFRLPFWDPLRPRTTDRDAVAGWTLTDFGEAVSWSRDGFTYGLSAILTKKKLEVTMPPVKKGSGPDVRVVIDNPLYSYRIPTLDELKGPSEGIDKFQPSNYPASSSKPSARFDGDMKALRIKQNERTSRIPSAVHGYSQHTEVNKNFNNVADAKRLKLYRILTTDQSYVHMASTSTEMRIRKIAWKDASVVDSKISIESFHDDVHALVGGLAWDKMEASVLKANPIIKSLVSSIPGHMTIPKFAAFDPVFFLHHNNIERLLSLWQQAWPDRWWKKDMPADSEPSPDAQLGLPYSGPNKPAFPLNAYTDGIFYEATVTMYSAPYTWEKATTPLIPFRRPIDTSIPKAKRKKWWDTDAIEDYENLFGYSYDQLKMSGQKRKDADKARTMINKWFGWAHDNDDQGAMDRAEPVSRDLLPVNYDDWQNKFPAFTDDPALPVDDTPPSAFSAPVPVARPMALFMAAPLEVSEAGVFASETPSEEMEALSINTEEPRTATNGDSSDDSTRTKETAFNGPHPDIAAIQHHKTHWTPEPTSLQKNHILHWNFNYVVERNALQGAFVIYVFIGDFSSSPASWPSDPHLVMTAGIFTSGVPQATNPETDGDVDICPNCAVQTATQQDYNDFVPLTKMLMDYVRSQERQPAREEDGGLVLRSLQAEDVVPFLKRNLHWRVMGTQGPVEREDTSGLRVNVTSQWMKLPDKMSDMPVWGKEEVHVEITDSRPSGVSFAESPEDRERR